MFGLFDQSLLALLPTYGLSSGLSERVMASALGVLNAGSIILQLPIGWLADRFPRRIVLFGCALSTAIGALVLPLVIHHFLLWPLLFIWGAVAYGIATISMIELGDHFSGKMLLSGSAALTMMSGLGGILGSPIIGFTVGRMGPSGLPISLFCAFLILAFSILFFNLTKPQGV